jgi:2-polyprenyl-3-methyl-5-hydroxy-6-metoxy-1,4-benzoquinol methylase
MFRNLESKDISLIVAEWDVLAAARYRQISDGKDITFSKLIAPRILELVGEAGVAQTILDAGCGVGALTRMLRQKAETVIGIDPSQKSIEIARLVPQSGIEYINSTLEDYSVTNEKSVDLVVANMVLMNVIDLQQFLYSVSKALRPNGVLLFSIVHPCYWPIFCGYDKEAWFDYSKEILIEGLFRISSEPENAGISTHLHRPLEQYISAMRKAGLVVDLLEEPMPNHEVAKLYNYVWVTPRYIIGRSRVVAGEDI